MAATLEAWQAPLYVDALTIYRNDERDRDNRGNMLGVRQVFTGELCLMHATGNFDEPNGSAAQSKRDNVDTSDKVDCHLSLDVRAEDIAKIVTSDGRTEWLRVAGAPKKRPLLGYQHFFIVTIAPRKIIAGTWNG